MLCAVVCCLMFVLPYSTVLNLTDKFCYKTVCDGEIGLACPQVNFGCLTLDPNVAAVLTCSLAAYAIRLPFSQCIATGRRYRRPTSSFSLPYRLCDFANHTAWLPSCSRAGWAFLLVAIYRVRVRWHAAVRYIQQAQSARHRGVLLTPLLPAESLVARQNPSPSRSS